MSVEALSNTTFTIERKTISNDVLGGIIRTWASVGTGTGRVQPVKAITVDELSKDAHEVTHNVYTMTTGIIPGDRLVLEDETVLHVLGTINRDLLGANPIGHFQLLCEQRDDYSEATGVPDCPECEDCDLIFGTDTYLLIRFRNF